MTITLSTPLTLPCGAVLSNRIVKAAMSEGLADTNNHATPQLEALYRRWGGSGAGMLLSGNIQIDRDHLERPLNIVLENEAGLDALRKVVVAAKSGGSAFWAQLAHTGRQVVDHINQSPLAPSTVEIEVLRGAGYSFAPPVAMTEAQIEDAIQRFATTARLARQAGFDGLQFHGAHGYLISQFLSPKTNLRADSWGGTLENRARFLLETLAAVRDAVGDDFPIGLKLNASDFQKGGFTNAECLQVVRWLNETSLDLLEISGGSLEQPKLMGVTLLDEGEDARPESTRQREAYFLDFAASIRAVAKMPVMVTGGFRTRSLMESALADGELDLVGLGRPMVADPELPLKLLAAEINEAPRPEDHLELFHLMPWLNMQIERMGAGSLPDPELAGLAAAEQFAALETGNVGALLAARAVSESV